ncbi:transposable element Tc3 transposase [Trichonephila clavipes]|nr:transposable element Tc3 transposase [Trichonephila clavipes]
MFSDESRFSLQSDSRRTLIWRAPGTCYHQENTIERHRYGGAGFPISKLRKKVYLFVYEGVMNQLQIPSCISRSLQLMDDLP